MERLNKALARAGVASRRAVDELIRAGKVSVNGQVVTQLGQKVDVRLDRVLVDGKRVALISEEAQVKVYFLLNKPPKVLTTAKDDRGRSTVMDYVAGAAEGRIYPVGRLDYDAEGALLLTNDGELAAKLMHPRTHVAKVYQVKVKGEPEERQLDLLRRGIRLEDGPTRACKIDVVKKARVNTWVEVTLTEGKNRQLKRMFWRIRHPVLKILRVKYGPVDLGDLGTGEFRELKRAEVEALRKAVDVAGTARPHA
ncbi:MAG: rRNA pseudouridine synthase [Deltaproteobacteria bacterium]|nr:rRNA pseudouridine synthase [Deltaproteobacteria bacterium]